MIYWTWRIGGASTGLRDTQPETVEDRIREPMTKLRDTVGTGIHDMGFRREGVHTQGRR